MRKKIISAMIGLGVVLAFCLANDRCSKDLELPTGQGTPDSVYVETRIYDVVSNFKTISVQMASVEIQNVNNQTNKIQWRTLKLAKQGAIELQKLTVTDTILALSRFYTGSLLQLHIVFDNNMKVVLKNGTNTAYNVTLLKNDVYIPISQPLVKGCDYVVKVNMNTAKSIVSTGVGKYQFDPSFVTATPSPVTGSITGIVTPTLSDPNVFAILNGKDTVCGTLISPDGHFLLRGLTPGNYTVSFQPLSGYTPVTKPAVITSGNNTDIGTVSLD